MQSFAGCYQQQRSEQNSKSNVSAETDAHSAAARECCRGDDARRGVSGKAHVRCSAGTGSSEQMSRGVDKESRVESKRSKTNLSFYHENNIAGT